MFSGHGLLYGAHAPLLERGGRVDDGRCPAKLAAAGTVDRRVRPPRDEVPADEVDGFRQAERLRQRSPTPG
jgi:hypothetical protein